jgi:hypothetical protein
VRERLRLHKLESAFEKMRQLATHDIFGHTGHRGCDVFEQLTLLIHSHQTEQIPSLTEVVVPGAWS